jgi:hypothetical protein
MIASNRLALVFAVVFAVVGLGGCRSAPPETTSQDSAPTDAQAWHPAPPKMRFHRPTPHLPPRAPDLRTPEQITRLACTKSDGSWSGRCNPALKPMVAAAAPLPAAPKPASDAGPALQAQALAPMAIAAGTGLPPMCSAPLVVVDPLNVSGCAKDTNNCTTTSCGNPGVGPCVTNAEIAIREGGVSPGPNTPPQQRLILSSNAGLADPVQWTPCVAPAAVDYVSGQLQPVGTCTISNVSNIVRGSASVAGTLPHVTASCITADWQQVVNVTHSSVTWSKTETSETDAGGTWTLLRPMAPLDPENYFTRENVDDWANGDTINVFNVLHVEIDNVGTECGNGNGYFGVNDLDDVSSFSQFIGQFPILIEGRVDGFLNMVGSYPEVDNSVFVDGNLRILDNAGSEPIVLSSANAAIIAGGYYGAGGLSYILGASFDLGVDVEGPNTIQGNLTDIYLGGGLTELAPGTTNVFNDSFVWGPSTLEGLPGSTLVYACNTANTVFLQGASASFGALAFGSSGSRPCAINGLGGSPSPAQLSCFITSFATSFDLPVVDGGCGGGCFGSGVNLVCQ